VQPAWNLRTNPKAMGIANPIRELIEKMGAPNPDKPVIALSQGTHCRLHTTVFCLVIAQMRSPQRTLRHALATHTSMRVSVAILLRRSQRSGAWG
jgi:hypothetical protein